MERNRRMIKRTAAIARRVDASACDDGSQLVGRTAYTLNPEQPRHTIWLFTRIADLTPRSLPDRSGPALRLGSRDER